MTLIHRVIAICLKLIPVSISLLAILGSSWEYILSLVEPSYDNIDYDFIIVGAGSAGCVLANRLSEDPSINVLLVEAGGAPSVLTGIPALASHVQMSPYDWQYETVPQENACLAMQGQKNKWPAGKMLGGSSGLNYMIYMRGNRQDYDGWSESTGDARWSYEKLLPYFLRAEGYSGRYSADKLHHGSDGPLKVRDSIYLSPLSKAYQSMAAKHGLEVDDFNNDDPSGFDVPLVTLDESGTRADTYRSYLLPVLHRSNLRVLKHAHVTRVLIDPGTKSAYGVELVRYGSTKNIKAKREVILSAGAIGSPKILLHSGIGPEDHLAQLEIPVLKSLPVGNNLHDHIMTFLGSYLIDEPLLFNPIRMSTPSVAWDYLVHGRGPLTATVACDCVGHLRINSSEPTPDVQYIITGVSLQGDYGSFFRESIGIPIPVYDAFVAPHYGMDGATVLPVVLRPKSRGTLRLQSPDPFDPPLLDPQYLSHPDDLKTLVEAIKTIHGMLTSDPELVSKYGYRLQEAPLPGCENEHGDEYWSCYVRHFTMTMYHPVGTCSMGTNESNSVVSPELEVHGVRNLRVVDASIMPKIVSGNTNAPVIAIAEMASDLIKNSGRRTVLSGKGRSNHRKKKVEL